MNLLIVAATDLEIISKKLKKLPTLITGVGMVNMSISLTEKLFYEKYDFVINIGIAGSFKKNFKNGDVIEVVEDTFSEVGYYDDANFKLFTNMDLKTTYLSPPKTSLEKVRSVTVNCVNGNVKQIEALKKRLNPDIENMEGAAFFQVCEKFNIPCLQIRSVSNKVEKRDLQKWDIDLAVKNLNEEAEKIIYSL